MVQTGLLGKKLRGAERIENVGLMCERSDVDADSSHALKPTLALKWPLISKHSKSLKLFF